NVVKRTVISLNSTHTSDRRFLAFDSGSSTPDPADTDHNLYVFVRDPQTNTTTLVSRASGTGGAKANNPSQDAAISADGRFVAFESFSTNLTPDANRGIEQVFVRDLQTNTTTLVSRASGANAPEGDDESDSPAISADGRFVAFTSLASNLDPADGLTGGNLFVRDLQTNTTTLVSRASGANGALANSVPFDPSISADGRFVAFASFASNLDPEANNANGNVFVRDLQANTTMLVSRASGANGATGDNSSLEPAISADGRFVAFQSDASNL